MTAAGGLIQISYEGNSRDIENMLRAFYNAFDDSRVASDLLPDHIYPVLRERLSQRFEAEGDDVVGAWLPLAETTVRIRGSAHPINVRTGALKGAMLNNPPRIERHSLGATMWFPGDVSSDIQDKLQVAQYGGVTPQGQSVPPRPILGVNEADLELIMVALGEYIAKVTQEEMLAV